MAKSKHLFSTGMGTSRVKSRRLRTERVVVRSFSTVVISMAVTSHTGFGDLPVCNIKKVGAPSSAHLVILDVNSIANLDFGVQ